LKFNSIELAKSAYIAKDGDPKHTTVCNSQAEKQFNSAFSQLQPGALNAEK